MLLRRGFDEEERVVSMSMNEIIRQKRKELDYTQEQVASQLGVSIPAVSKWESGTTYPDVELLPALARVLKIDVNTLLCFKVELSEIEIENIVKNVYETAMSHGIENAFLLTEQKIHEYPTDVKLIHTLALTLQGTMMMTKVSDSEKERYDSKIQQMYERVGNSNNAKYANQSNYMLASQAIKEGNYDRAQELIDRLPEYTVLDKKIMQANLWMEMDKVKEAEQIYASRLLSGLSQIQLPLIKLIEIAAKSGDTENAAQLVEVGQAFTKAFGLWEYNSYVFAFEKAMAEKNVSDTIIILKQMIDAMLTPWNISDCPIHKHMGDDKHELDLGKKMIANVLEELEKSEKYDFLRKEDSFRNLINQYKLDVSERENQLS